MPYQPPQFRPPRRHEIAGLRYYRTASAYNWLGVAMAHPTRAIQLLLEQCEPDVLSPMFNIEIDAILAGIPASTPNNETNASDPRRTNRGQRQRNHIGSDSHRSLRPGNLPGRRGYAGTLQADRVERTGVEQMEQAMREEFEAWVWDIYEETLWFDMNREFVLKRNGDEYFGNFLNDRWEAWKASRAALRVELPERRDPLNSTGDDENPRSAGFNDCLERVTEALQQAGIEVKHGTA
nr:hypothetical protein [Pseudomonas aeruginosa]